VDNRERTSGRDERAMEPVLSLTRFRQALFT